jgi:hypothetical protein
MSYDPKKANAKVLALRMAHGPALRGSAPPTIENWPCGCVVATNRGHIHTKFCDQHIRTTREEIVHMETDKSEDLSGPVPLDPKQLLKEEKPVAAAKVKKEPKKKAPKKELKAKAKTVVKEAKRAVKDPGDGLGRENTAGRTICERLVAGDTNEKAVAAARKKHPDNKIADNYGAWYRNKLIKAGKLKAAK